MNWETFQDDVNLFSTKTVGALKKYSFFDFTKYLYQSIEKLITPGYYAFLEIIQFLFEIYIYFY